MGLAHLDDRPAHADLGMLDGVVRPAPAKGHGQVPLLDCLAWPGQGFAASSAATSSMSICSSRYGDMAKTFRQMVRDARGQIKVISPQEAKPIIDLGAAMLIDVREAWEIAQHGTIPGARNLTRGELEIKADT